MTKTNYNQARKRERGIYGMLECQILELKLVAERLAVDAPLVADWT